MRKPKGKLVALLAGAVAVVLVAMLWGDIYCYLFLDRRLMGQWARESYVRDEPTFLEFDRIGNVVVVCLFLPHKGPPTEKREVHTYRIDKGSLLLSDDAEWGYEVEGDTLTLARAGGPLVYQRLSDDS